MSAPARRDLDVTSGDDYEHRFTFTDNDRAPIDLTGRTFNAQVRLDVASAGTADATFAVDLTDAATGVIVLSLTAAQTTALTVGARYSWDLEQLAAGKKTTVLSGRVAVSQDVTR